MSSSPDLFVVCKQCASEVSPYITECPYCGARLRRRAPKLPRAKRRGGILRRLEGVRGFSRTSSGQAPVRTGLRRRGLSRRRGPRDHPYSPAESPPYATIALVAAGCAGWVLVRGGYVDFSKLAVEGPLHGDWWKLFSSPFAYEYGLYAFVALLATAIFGWLLERRHGPAIMLVVFFGGAVTGALAASAVYAEPIVSGANAGALALIGAWSISDLQAARRNHYYEGDLLGTCAIAATLLLAPYARPEASWLAGVVGAIVGLVFGLGMQLIEAPEP
jgi:membrane associated rhomboid family serine protease